jgi:small nuclear ribonucleoprotein (snRNP)-like protein
MSSAAALPDSADPAHNLESLLTRLLRITIPDGRYFIGRFTCVDHKVNIVLTDAEEFLPSPKTDEEKAAREVRERYFPRSQRGGGEGEGWGRYAIYDEEEQERGLKDGRMLGMILITGKDVTKIELIDEVPGTGGMSEGYI